MAMQKIDIATTDGVCPSYVFAPPGDGAGKRGVLCFMDGLGIRPAMLEVGERIAALGYWVLLPDLFYRAGAYEPMDPVKVFGDPEQRKRLFEKFFPHASAAKIMSDTPAFLAALARYAPGPVGTTGYCMGGRMSFCAAGHFGAQIAVSAAFHPSGLATEAADSPHLLAPQIAARVYVGGASDDAGFDPAQQQRLVAALTAANVRHALEVYPAKHGWVFRDTPVFDEACRERHYATLQALFAEALG